MTNLVKKAAPSVTVITIAAIVTNIIWGTPFKLIKLMNAEMGISKELLGNNYLGQVLATISIRFFLAGIMTLIFAKIIGQKIFKVKKSSGLKQLLWG